LAKGRRDYLSFHTVHDPASTWKNKYKKDKEGNLVPFKNAWYYFGFYKPTYQEAFPFSTTMFVAFTDKWHKYESLQGHCVVMVAASLMPTWWMFGTAFVVGQTLRAIGFKITYK